MSVVVVLALIVATLGGTRVTRPRIALASVVAGTTVGSAQYPVPTGAIIVSPSGKDSAAGTASAPLLTLGHAIDVAASGATIVMRAGSYHESVVIPSDKRLTIQSWPGEAVWLDGSVAVTSWTASGTRWRTPWSVKFDHSPTFTRGAPDNSAANWGFVNPAYPMAAHPDQVWVAGVALRQVGSLAQVTAGTFFNDETNKTLWIGSDPAGKAVRASTLITALRITSSGSIVRGIGIRRYAPSVPDMGAVTVERPNVLIENVAITDSATAGLHVGASGVTTSGVTLHDVEVADSGMLGISATYADNITLDGVETKYNNLEHFNTAPVSGGVKISRTRGIVVRNSVMRNNDGPGLWLDESSYNATITGNDIRDNTKHGIALEISAKATVSNNTIVANGGFGIKVNNTASVTISNNTFDSNRDRSVNLVQDSRRPTSATTAGRDKRQPFPDPTMTWLLGPVTVTNNVISNQTGGTCMLCVEDYTQTRSAAQIGVTANGDSYVRPSASVPTYLIVWSRGPGNPAVYQSVTSFHSATGQEATGSVSNTAVTTTTGAATTPVTPGAPASVSAAPGEGSATISWIAPSDDNGGTGSAVTGYVVMPYAGLMPLPAITFDSRATTEVVTGLTNAASYTFRVAAKNVAGTGAQSLVSKPVVVGLATAPTGVFASASSGRAAVRWTAPAHNGGSAITGYVVTPYVSGVAQPVSRFASTATAQTVTGLTNAKPYTFKVAAVNAHGPGVQSAAIAPIVVGAPAPPSAPAVTSVVAGVAQATLTWSAPASSGSASIIGFVVTPYLAGVAQPVRSYNAAAGQVVTGLISGKKYTFRVAARNTAGTGAMSAMSAAVTPT